MLCETAIKGGKRIEYVEPSLCYIVAHNVLVAFIRTHITIGENTDIYTSLAFSYDKGESFTKPIPTSVKGHPMHPILIGDRLVLIYGYREEPFGVRMIVLDVDEFIRRKTIDTDNEIILEDKMTSGDCGYPWALYDEKAGGIVCCYYGAFKDGVRSIKMLRFAL